MSGFLPNNISINSANDPNFNWAEANCTNVHSTVQLLEDGNSQTIRNQRKSTSTQNSSPGWNLSSMNWIMIALTTLLISLILVLIVSVLQQSKAKSIPSQGLNLEPLPTIVVKSPADLLKIGEGTHTLRIRSLNSSFRNWNPSEITKRSLKTIEFAGPITTQGLHQILQMFPHIENLKVDVDAVCSGFSNTTPTTNFRSKEVDLSFVKSLLVENSERCKILDWGFPLGLPNLEKVEVKSSLLSKSYFEHFKKLLMKSEESLKQIFIRDSFICNDCDITDIQFQNVHHVSVTNRVERRHNFNTL